jgi:UDP-N-acetyl-D-mannosaminuronate dehydrogenase
VAKKLTPAYLTVLAAATNAEILRSTDAPDDLGGIGFSVEAVRRIHAEIMVNRIIINTDTLAEMMKIPKYQNTFRQRIITFFNNLSMSPVSAKSPDN